MSDDTYEKPKHGWTCFHCGETFTTIGGARDHFGAQPTAMPGCMIRVAYGNERGLEMEVRKLEEESKRYREEDSDLHRQMYAMETAHRTALRREEEKGYARGLADAKKHPGELGLVEIKEQA